MTIYDDLREKCLIELRRDRLAHAKKNRGPTLRGAYAMLHNPFERALLRRKTKQRRERLRVVRGVIDEER